MSMIKISNCLPLFQYGGYLWLRTAEVYNGFKLTLTTISPIKVVTLYRKRNFKFIIVESVVN